MKRSTVILLAFMLGAIVTSAYSPATAEIKTIPYISNQSGVELSPDGKTIATHEIGVIQGDEVIPGFLPIRLFDVETGSERSALVGHTDYAVDIAFSPDSKTLASYHFPGYIYLWNAENGTLIKEIPTTTGVTGIRFLADGKTLVMSINNPYNLMFLLLDTETGYITRVIMNRFESRDDFMNYVDEHVPADFMSAFTVSPDEKSLIVMMASGNLFRWDAETGEAAVLKAVEETLPVFFTRKVIFSHDASSILYEHRDEQVIYVLDAVTGAERAVIPAPNIYTFDLAPDNDTLVWLGNDPVALNVVSLAQPDAPPTVIPLAFREGVRVVGPTVTLSFLPDEKRVMLGGMAKTGDPENALYVVTVK